MFTRHIETTARRLAAILPGESVLSGVVIPGIQAMGVGLRASVVGLVIGALVGSAGVLTLIHNAGHG